jgi:signal transduction histidine kinase
LGLEQPGGQGSAGEKGQGLGLLLAREHLMRQGGRLELRARPGGGTEAIVWIKAA